MIKAVKVALGGLAATAVAGGGAAILAQQQQQPKSDSLESPSGEPAKDSSKALEQAAREAARTSQPAGPDTTGTAPWPAKGDDAARPAKPGGPKQAAPTKPTEGSKNAQLRENFEQGREAAKIEWPAGAVAHFEAHADWMGSGKASYREAPKGFDRWNLGRTWRDAESASKQTFTQGQVAAFKAYRAEHRPSGGGATPAVLRHDTPPKGYSQWVAAEHFRNGELPFTAVEGPPRAQFARSAAG